MADGTRDIKFDTAYSTTVDRLARSQKENIGEETYKASNEDNLFVTRYDLMIFASSLAINLGKEKKLTTNKKKLATLVPANIILLHDSRIESGQSLKNKIYEVKKLITENNDLYGSIKPTEISKLINDYEKIDVKPSLIQPLKEIKSLGSFKVKINLHAEVQAEIAIKVISQDNIK